MYVIFLGTPVSGESLVTRGCDSCWVMWPVGRIPLGGFCCCAFECGVFECVMWALWRCGVALWWRRRRRWARGFGAGRQWERGRERVSVCAFL